MYLFMYLCFIIVLFFVGSFRGLEVTATYLDYLLLDHGLFVYLFT